MFILSETFPAPIAKRILGQFETPLEAQSEAIKRGALVIEPDADNPGCFDIFTKSGAILTIEPDCSCAGGYQCESCREDSRAL